MTSARSTSLVCLTLLAVSLAAAQSPTPPTPTTPPGSPTAPLPPPQGPRFGVDHARMAEVHARMAEDRARMTEQRSMGRGPERGNMGIIPPGTWWKNPDTVTRLSLTADQQKKMDDILRQNRIALIDLKASLEKEEINLEPLLNANPVDSPKALAQISKIADERAGLEKANAKMLLGLRSVLTADQWTKLQEGRHPHPMGPVPDGRGQGEGRGQGRGPGSPQPPPATNY
jgi:Spy/CpxP family protein refolding chaperone